MPCDNLRWIVCVFSGSAPGNTLNSPCHGKHGEAHGTTAIATSIYTNMPCDNLRWIVTPSFLPQICIVLEVALLKFHTKFAPGWAHIWVNFDPIRGNWAKSLGVSTLSWVGAILQDYGIAWCKSQLFVYRYSLTQHPMFNSHSAGLHYWWKDSVLSNWKHKAFLDWVLSLIASDQKVNPGKPPPPKETNGL